MQTTLISSLFKTDHSDGSIITVQGWIKTLRDSKTFAFIELNDGSYFKNLQIVCDENLQNFKEITKLSLGSSLTVTGQLIMTPAMKQPFELKAQSIVIEGSCEADFPLQKKRHSFEYLRTIAHLRPRTNTFYAVFKIRSLAAQAMHHYLHEHGFVYIHTPIITTSDAEGAGEMFQVTTLDLDKLPRGQEGDIQYKNDFFGKHASLTVSGQLNVEAFCMAFRNVYTFGPTFRAENSNTSRHAAEFWMIEPELAFADLDDIMDMQEDMFRTLIGNLLNQAPDEFSFLNQFVDKKLKERLEHMRDSEFARCSYTQAIEILQNADRTFEYPVAWGIDLQTEHERYLTEVYFERPTFVYNYPKDIKAFYMRLNDDDKTVAAVDLLVPGVGELVGGSQREERFDVLMSRISQMGLDAQSYTWYTDLRRFGTVKHAGFGIGFERFIMYITGMTNIRDVLPYPRTVGNAEF